MPKASSNPTPSKKTTRAASRRPRKPALTARTADKFRLYELSVQDPDFEVRLIDKAFASRGRQAQTLREDFCGSALLCSRWVASSSARRATGIDLDPEVLAWGRKHNLDPMGDDARRIRLLEQDVREVVAPRHDVTAALNFSYWVFKTREALREYFVQARRGLKRDGLFILDAYGGWESQEPMFEPRRVKPGFTYVWDQDAFDPISHDVLNHIHFEFKDGSKLNRAFSYDWRFWSLVEIRELLHEAGFAHVEVWWDDSDDDDDPKYRPRKHATNQPGWIAYLFASPTIPDDRVRAQRSLGARHRGAVRAGRTRASKHSR